MAGTVVFDFAFMNNSGADFTATSTGRPFQSNLWMGVMIFTSVPVLNQAALDAITTKGDIEAISPAERLVYWQNQDDTSTQMAFIQPDAVSNPHLQTLTTHVFTASNTGTAAQFIMWKNNSTIKTSDPGAGSGVEGIMSGTITGTGGGGDMVIANTSIVSGLEYRVNWTMRMYDAFTF